jgi:hypothetical protein
MAAIKNNKGKSVVLVLYVLAVFVGPLFLFTPSANNFLASVNQQLAPPTADAFFKQYLGLLQQDNLSGANALLSQQGGGPVTTSTAEQSIAAMLASTTKQMEIVGGHSTFTTSEGTTTASYDVYYQIKNNDPVYKYVVAEIVAQQTGSGFQILSLNVIPETQSVQELGKFNFATQGIYLILSLLIPAFVAYTAFRYITKGQKPGWVLFLVILLVTAYISVSNGTWGVSFGFNQFATKGRLFGPWIFFTPIPFGAIYYYFVRKRYESKPTQ